MFALRNALFHLTVVTSAFIAAPAIAGGNSGETKINWFKTLLSEDYSLQDSIHSPALGWVMVSFLVYAAIVFFVLSKSLPKYLAQRSELIRQAIDEASEAKKEAEANMRKYEERMAKLDDELKQLREDLSQQGQTEYERIEESAERAAAKMHKDTEATIDAELQKALAQLQAETAKQSYELAKAHLTSSLNNDDQTRLEDSFLEDLNRQPGA